MRCRALLLTILVLGACSPGAPRTTSAPAPSVPEPVTSAQQSGEPKPGNCQAAHVSPRPIVASRRGRILLLRPSDGNELCTLVTYERVPGLELSLAPDGETLYFSDYGLGACGRIFAVDMSDRTIRTVVRGGYGQDVSPDGRLLAYNASHSCGDRRHRIVVRDLSSGAEREWVGTWEGGYGSDVVWAPDPRFVVVARSGADAARYFLLDTAKTGPLDGKDWPPIDEDKPPSVNGIPLTSPALTLGDATVRPDAKAVMFAVYYSEQHRDERHPILEFDVKTRAFRTIVDRDGTPLAFDPSGEQLLYRGLGAPNTLFRYSAGRSVLLGEGFYDADW